jgi:YVTN family beta-propeller protein
MILLGIVAGLMVASGGLRPTGSPPSPISASISSQPRVVGEPAAGLSGYRLAGVPLESDGQEALQATPSWLAYDHADGSFYVAVPPSSVDIVPGNFTTNPVVAAVIPVGAVPFGVAYDNASGEIFVANSGSNNVSVLQGNLSAPIASIPVGTEPMGVTYDPVNGDIFVANNGSDDVSVISGSTLALLATVQVGSNPLGLAADPDTGKVFVANHGSSNVSVISSGAPFLVTNVGAGTGPYGVAVDNLTDDVYVTDEGSADVSVISAVNDALLTSILVSDPQFPEVDLQGIAYDVGSGVLWVGAGRLTVAAIEPIGEYVAAVDNIDPSGVAYDPDTGDICVTNTANATFECAQWTTSRPTQVPLTFYETGLPLATPWTVTLEGGSLTQTSSNASLTFNVTATAPQEVTYSVLPSGPYFPSPSSGTVDVDPYGNTVDVSFSTRPGVYPVSVNESGLPLGSEWAAFLGNLASTSYTTSITFAETDGTYAYTIFGPPGYTAEPTSGSVTVAGGPETLPIVFAPDSFIATFLATGLPSGASWTVSAVDTTNGVIVTGSSSGPNLTLKLPVGSYALSPSAPPGYSVTLTQSLLTVAGAGSTSLTATFIPVSSPAGTSVWTYVLVGVGTATLIGGIIAIVLGARVSRRPPHKDNA